jgi:hypothetical protein
MKLKSLLRSCSLIAALLLPGAPLFAQAPVAGESDDVRAVLEMMRSDVNGTKIRTLNQVMKLTAPEAEKFWPVYWKYEKELAEVGNRKLDLIREFAGHHVKGTLDDKNAKAMAAKWLKNVQVRLDLWKKYHKEIGKAVSPIRAAQFLQVEHQMALFIDLNIASEMPVLESKP